MEKSKILVEIIVFVFEMSKIPVEMQRFVLGMSKIPVEIVGFVTDVDVSSLDPKEMVTNKFLDPSIGL